MDASQFRYPETVYSVPKHKFCIHLPVEGLRNAPKHSQTSFSVKRSTMNASQLRYPETVYSGSKHKFCILVPPNSAFRLGRKVYIFYLLKVSKMLRNTPKHQFGSNEVDWKLHNFGTPKQCIQSQNTSFASFYLSKVSDML
jgi:hypothetical protein